MMAQSQGRLLRHNLLGRHEFPRLYLSSIYFTRSARLLPGELLGERYDAALFYRFEATLKGSDFEFLPFSRRPGAMNIDIYDAKRYSAGVSVGQFSSF